ncbi:MAG: tetratricopeptide repeat protein [Verrucomicrobiota bacterium]|nr:tetratricopeptide repeat protein [Verrucomicrobiota bacterium]
MENKGRQKNKQQNPAQGASAKCGPRPLQVARGKSFRQRLVGAIASILVCILALAVFELGLRLIGYGYATAFFVKHPAAGAANVVENRQFAWRFMPVTLARRPEPIVLPVQKPEKTCRIFVFGESAAIGDPAPAFGFSRILDVLLRERYPSIRFEVVNTAFTAINSHVILPIAHDAQRFGGDFWLVYMGNNEVIGPFGSGTVFGKQSPPLPVIRASLAIKTTKIGQLLDAAAQRLVPSPEAKKGWGGMDMFLEQQVRRDDPRLMTLHDHFKKNLADIISLGTSSGAKVIVSTMVSNLRDLPPFGSMHRPGLSVGQLKEWERLYSLATAAEQNRNFSEAIRNYALAAQIDDEFAELHFRWGRCSLARGNLDDAKVHFVLARDLDTLRFRTDSHLNELIRQVAAGSTSGSVRLVDAEKEFNTHSPDQIAGSQFLYEHVHFTFAGNYLLARLFADQIAALLSSTDPKGASSNAQWLSESDCAARLAYTDTQRYEIANLLLRRYEEPIYRRQLEYNERFKRQQLEVAGLRTASKPTARRRGLDACRQALARNPNDWVLHDLCARLLTALEEFDSAEKEWQQVAKLIPHSARPHVELGKIKLQLNKLDDALSAFHTAVQLDPVSADAHAGLGKAYRLQGKHSEALRHLKTALRLDPTQKEAAELLSN